MRSVAVLAALAVGHLVAMAQVVVTYGPVDVASVPTLSEWGMIIMSVLLAVVAVIAMRKKAGSKAVMSIALGAAVMFGVAQGNKYVSEAIAIPDGMTSTTVGTFTTPLLNVDEEFEVFNRTSPSIPLRIISVEPAESAQGTFTGSPPCTPGSIVAADTSCYVKGVADPNG